MEISVCNFFIYAILFPFALHPFLLHVTNFRWHAFPLFPHKHFCWSRIKNTPVTQSVVNKFWGILVDNTLRWTGIIALSWSWCGAKFPRFGSTHGFVLSEILLLFFGHMFRLCWFWTSPFLPSFTVLRKTMEHSKHLHFNCYENSNSYFRTKRISLLCLKVEVGTFAPQNISVAVCASQPIQWRVFFELEWDS